MIDTDFVFFYVYLNDSNLPQFAGDDVYQREVGSLLVIAIYTTVKSYIVCIQVIVYKFSNIAVCVTVYNVILHIWVQRNFFSH